MPPGWGLVTIGQMVATLVSSLEAPAKGIRIVEVPEIVASGGAVKGRP